MEQYSQLIASVGFPIVISMYLLIYLNNELKELTKIISQLSEKIDRICND